MTDDHVLSETGRPRRRPKVNYKEMNNPAIPVPEEVGEDLGSKGSNGSSSGKSASPAKKGVAIVKKKTSKADDGSGKQSGSKTVRDGPSKPKEKIIYKDDMSDFDEEGEDDQETQYISAGVGDESDSDYEEDGKVYCYCRQPDDGNCMVECDKCNEWYHGKCIGLTQKDVDKIDVFQCENCKPDGKGYPKNVVASVKAERQSSKFSSSASTKKGSSNERRKSAVDSSSRNKSRAQVKTANNSRSTSSASSNAQSFSPIRINARKGLTDLFNKTLETAQANPDKYPGVDVKETKHFWGKSAADAAVDLEKEMFDQLSEIDNTSYGLKTCGEKYKVKYRQLKFNFSDVRNDKLRLRLLKGEISISGLVAMTSEQLANEEVTAKLEEIRNQSLLNVLKGSFAKEQLEKKELGKLTEGEVISELISKSDIESKKRKSSDIVEEDIEAKTKKLFMAETKKPAPNPLAKEIKIERRDISDITGSSASTSANRNTSEDEHDKYDDIIEYSSDNNFAPSEDEDGDNDHGEEEQEEQEQAKLEIINGKENVQIWQGRVNMHGFGEYNVDITTLNITPEYIKWNKIFTTSSIEIAGRVPPMNVESYIAECRRTNSSLAFLHTRIEDNDILWDYFVSKNRLPVVKMASENGIVKDAYLLPVNRDIPLFMKTKNPYIDSGKYHKDSHMWVLVLVFERPPEVDIQLKESLEKERDVDFNKEEENPEELKKLSVIYKPPVPTKPKVVPPASKPDVASNTASKNGASSLMDILGSTVSKNAADALFASSNRSQGHTTSTSMSPITPTIPNINQNNASSAAATLASLMASIPVATNNNMARSTAPSAISQQLASLASLGTQSSGTNTLNALSGSNYYKNSNNNGANGANEALAKLNDMIRNSSGQSGLATQINNANNSNNNSNEMLLQLLQNSNSQQQQQPNPAQLLNLLSSLGGNNSNNNNNSNYNNYSNGYNNNINNRNNGGYGNGNGNNHNQGYIGNNGRPSGGNNRQNSRRN